jgi:hypothetical protein
MIVTKSKKDVFEDHTVKDDHRHTSEPALPPGPPDPGDEPDQPRRSPGFSNVPGAGPNPTQPNR